MTYANSTAEIVVCPVSSEWFASECDRFASIPAGDATGWLVALAYAATVAATVRWPRTAAATDRTAVAAGAAIRLGAAALAPAIAMPIPARLGESSPLDYVEGHVASPVRTATSRTLTQDASSFGHKNQ